MSSSDAPRSQVIVKVPLLYGADVLPLLRELHKRMAGVPGVLEEPVSEVGILEFLPTGPVVHLTAWCALRDMHRLKGQLHAVAYEVLYTAGYAPPEQSLRKMG